MGASVDTLLVLSEIVSLLSLSATVLLAVLMLRSSVKHLRDVLSNLDRTLRLCASLLHSIAGASSTVEPLEKERGA